LVDLRRKLPAETKNHVPLILASVILARNPEQYGLPTKLDPPMEYKKVPVSKPIDLRAAAKVLTTTIDELKGLNPSLRGLTTPANYANYKLKVPVDSDPAVKEKLAALPRATLRPPPDFNGRHKIQPGETLSEIAVRYHISISELERANNLLSRHKIRAGSWLQVPTRPDTQKKSSASQRTTSPTISSNSGADKQGGKKTGTIVTENRGPMRDISSKP
jgi:membrane-bound lytic murein transglycosylase D